MTDDLISHAAAIAAMSWGEASTIAIMKDNTEMVIVCDACGEPAATARGEWQDFEYNDGRKSMMLRAYVDVISCASCGTQYTGPDAEERRHEAICGHLGRMTPAAIRALATPEQTDALDHARDEAKAQGMREAARIARIEAERLPIALHDAALKCEAAILAAVPTAEGV